MKQSSGVNPDQSVVISIADLQRVLKDVEVMLQSLHRVGSFYADDSQKCHEEVIRIVVGFKFVDRLARVRYLLSMAYERDLPATEIEKLEETLGRVRHWRPPKQAKPGE